MPDMETITAALNYIDFIVFAVMSLSILIGLVRGFTREFFGALAWTGAVLITFWGHHYLQAPMRSWMGNSFLADLITIIVLFIVALFTLLSMTRSLSLRVKASVLGGLDRSLGIIFGFGRGAVICIAAFLIVNSLWKPHNRPRELVTARSYPFLLEATALFSRLLPKGTIPAAFYHPQPLLDEAGKSILPILETRSAEDLMEALAKPKTLAQGNKEASGYPEERRRDMDRLFKNYEKQEE